MRKLSAFLLILIIGIFSVTQYNINQIQAAGYTTLSQIEHKEYITVGGEFESSFETDVLLSYPIYVKKVFVKENQYVNRGQALFSIDLEKMQEAMSGNIDRELLNNMDYSEISYLKNSQSSIKYSDISNVVYAPEDGIVTRVNVSPGGVVLQNKTLVSIAQSDKLMARFSLSQQDYGKVSVGDKVEISPVAYSSYKYTGQISDKNAVIRKQATTAGGKVVIDVFAHIDNPDKMLASGLQINGKIQNGTGKTINALDYSFVNQDDNGEFVYILKKGKAKKVYVETGIETENQTEIITYFPKDTIFLSGDIKEGSRVLISE